MTDVDILTQEVQARSAFLRGSAIGFDDDPNGPGAPAQITNAPLGTWYHRPGLDLFYRKNLAGVWEEAGSGSGIDITQEPFTMTVDFNDPSAVTLDPAVVGTIKTQGDFDVLTGGNPLKYVNNALILLPQFIAHNVTIELAAGDHTDDVSNLPAFLNVFPFSSGPLACPKRFRVADVQVFVRGPVPSQWPAVDPSLSGLSRAALVISGDTRPTESGLVDFSAISPTLFAGFDLPTFFLRDDGQVDTDFFVVEQIVEQRSDSLLVITGSPYNPIGPTVSVVRPAARVIANTRSNVAITYGPVDDLYRIEDIELVAIASADLLDVQEGSVRLDRCRLDASALPASINQFGPKALDMQSLYPSENQSCTLFSCGLKSRVDNAYSVGVLKGQQAQFFSGSCCFYKFGAGLYLIGTNNVVPASSWFNQVGAAARTSVGNLSFKGGHEGYHTASLVILNSEITDFGDFGQSSVLVFASPPRGAIYISRNSGGPQAEFFGEDAAFLDVPGPVIEIGDLVSFDGTVGIQNWETDNCLDVVFEFVGVNSVVFTEDEFCANSAANGYVRFRDGDVPIASVTDLDEQGDGIRDAFGNHMLRGINE